MHREIKFRAWDNTSERFLENYELSLGIGRAGELFFSDNSEPFHKHGEVILMQYTGIHDKNGVEIYEGDIVRYEAVKLHPRTCTIVYEPEAAAFLLNDTSKGSINYVQMKYLGDMYRSGKNHEIRTYELCEIIGNIYANPELIKQGVLNPKGEI